MSEYRKELRQKINRFTNFLELFREKDTELSLQAMQILFLVSNAELKANEILDERERADTYMSIKKIASILNLTTASASRNVAALSTNARGRKPALQLINNDPIENRHPFNPVAKFLTLTDQAWEMLDELNEVFFDSEYKPYDLETRGSRASDKRKGLTPKGELPKSLNEKLKSQNERLRALESQAAKLEAENLALREKVESEGRAFTAKDKEVLQKIEKQLEEVARKYKIPPEELTIEMDYAGEEDEREVVKVTHQVPEPMQYTSFKQRSKTTIGNRTFYTNTFPLDAKKFQSRFDQWMKNRSPVEVDMGKVSVKGVLDRLEEKGIRSRRSTSKKSA